MNFLHPDIQIAAVVALTLTLLVFLLRIEDRVTARNMLVIAVIVIAIDILSVMATSSLPAQVANWLHDALYIALSAVIIRLAGLFIFRWFLPLVRVQPARIIEDLTVTGAFIGWVILWWRMAGVDLSSIVATSAVITGIIAFSMQETLGNVLGGLALQLDNSIRIGDWVRIDDVSGRVTEIRWRYTAVETRNRETVVIPNSYLLKNRFTVVGSRTDPQIRWRRQLNFSLSIEKGVSVVISTLEQAVVDCVIPNVAAEPPPTAVLMELLPSGARFVLRYFLTDPQQDDGTDSQVREHCYAALMRAGIAQAVPLEERFMVKENETWRTNLEMADQARRLKALKGVDIFRALSEDELTKLSRHLVHAPFVKGDVITRQGAVAHWLYLIISGEADVWAESPDMSRTHVAKLVAGNVFGEMGMMTGEPRRATVTAKTDVDCYRLDKAGFTDILMARPDLAGEISKVLADRNIELAKHRAEIERSRMQTNHQDILGKIRGFFGIKA